MDVYAINHLLKRTWKLCIHYHHHHYYYYIWWVAKGSVSSIITIIIELHYICRCMMHPSHPPHSHWLDSARGRSAAGTPAYRVASGTVPDWRRYRYLWRGGTSNHRTPWCDWSSRDRSWACLWSIPHSTQQCAPSIPLPTESAWCTPSQQQQ